ncbi:hypothetical protein SSP24_67550 [Streptomyces spinoverrucosus]|uniref:Protein kinase domain-containing protein n=1 Tax=Streptomyces spinoverrucosus TaxID=284043 RepID=A0A4Y3VTY7_9ACTN|nr:lipopolysaccharide kinase InaA family protein [Streptomyces spinoverrucosus]GEC09100.1 hypothetical protein SSP24_67550 [Streptomyces spinoverrucosus]GHB85423.1 hypothetical protein GCM10010397_66110 [Streptomyces spinoverrucosus]
MMTTVSWVRPDQLGDYTAHSLGAGGQGKVYAVPSPPGRFQGEYLAYKEYLPSLAYDADVLHDMVVLRDLLSPSDRALLDNRLTWPCAMVYTGRPPERLPPSQNAGMRVVGFLMPRVAPAYELHSPNLSEVKLQALEFLLNDDGYAARIGLHVDDEQRLALLLDLARTLDRLHHNGVSVGDLSPKNILFTQIGTPKCLLIDCDSMRCRGRDVMRQVETTGWEVPEPAKATTASDSWKFALVAARVFNRDHDSTDLAPLRAVSTELAGLASRGQSRDPARRPAMAEWLTALDLAQLRMHRPPPTAPAGNPYQPPRQQPLPPDPEPDPNPAPVPNPAPFQVWTPPQRPPAPSGTGGGGGLGKAVMVLLLVLAGLWAAVQYGPELVDSLTSSAGAATDNPSVRSAPDTGGTSPPPQDTSDPEPEPEPEPEYLAEAPGASVDYSQASDAPQAPEVAAMFAHFYGAINTKDYDKALGHYDPNTATVDLDSASSRDKWKEVMATTEESDIALTAVRDSGDFTLATVTFRSHQDPGYGPAGYENSTCTDWTITYQLTATDGYRIFKAPKEGVSHSPC